MALNFWTAVMLLEWFGTSTDPIAEICAVQLFQYSLDEMLRVPFIQHKQEAMTSDEGETKQNRLRPRIDATWS